jgi:hypothetical protein
MKSVHPKENPDQDPERILAIGKFVFNGRSIIMNIDSRRVIAP